VASVITFAPRELTTSGGSSPAASALGTSAKSASGPKRRRLTATERSEAIKGARASRWGIQGEGRRLMPRERVATCMWGVKPGVSQVAVLLSPQGQAHYGGLMTCGSVWVCPICAAKITERRRTELQAAVEAARAAGLRVLLLTYTFSHHAHQRLERLVGALLEATKAMKSGRRATQRNEAYGVIGAVRALECTYGDENGWHPHTHELVFLPQEADAEAYASEVREAWAAAAARIGMAMNEHGFDWSDTNERIADYVSKFGREPEWQESSELTKWHIKRAGGERMTPWDLLRASAEGDEQASALFVEYAVAFKGRRQLFWSPGLRETLRLGEELTDEELAEEPQEEAVFLGGLTRQQWHLVLMNDARAEVLAAAEEGGWAGVQALLASLDVGGEGS
jgi:hypothetical protein